jgi:hypothetical protein
MPSTSGTCRDRWSAQRRAAARAPEGVRRGGVGAGVVVVQHRPRPPWAKPAAGVQASRWMNQALRQELLALVEQDHAFVSAPDHDPNSDQVQRQRLELLGRLRRRLVEILDTYGWPGKSLSARTARWRPGCWRSIPCRPRGAGSLPEAAASCRGCRGGRAVAGRRPGGPRVAGGAQRPSVRDDDLPAGRWELGPPLLEDPDRVDTRRRAVGLPRLEQDIRRIEQFYSGN